MRSYKAWRKFYWKNLLQSDYFSSPSSVDCCKGRRPLTPRRRRSSCQTDPLPLFFSLPFKQGDVVCRCQTSLRSPSTRCSLSPMNPASAAASPSIGRALQETIRMGLWFVVFFQESSPRVQEKKEKTYLTYPGALQGSHTIVGVFSILKKKLISQQIWIRRKQKEEWHLFIFYLPPVAFLTLRCSVVNKSLRAVDIQSDILAEGLDSFSSLLRVKRKNKTKWNTEV